MSAPVVTIRGRTCGRRKNRAEDATVIQVRRVICTAEQAGQEEQDNVAIAVSIGMESKLPRNNLRCIAGTLDARKDFDVRVLEVEIARAERQAYEAKWLRVYALNEESGDAANAAYPDREQYFERFRQAMMDMATTPVFTKADLARKRSAIGRIWLRVEGAWHDKLRAAVAADVERLSAGR